MRSPSPTTTSMNVADSPAVREPIQSNAMPDPAASEGQKPLAPVPGTVGINSGLSCTDWQVRPITVQPVDRKTITGSTPGDFRKSGDSAKSAMDQIANPPGPREQMRGQQDGKHYHEDGKAFRSFPGNLVDSDAGN